MWDEAWHLQNGKKTLIAEINENSFNNLLASIFHQDDGRLSCLAIKVEAGTCCRIVEGNLDGAYQGRLDV